MRYLKDCDKFLQRQYVSIVFAFFMPQYVDVQIEQRMYTYFYLLENGLDCDRIAARIVEHQNSVRKCNNTSCVSCDAIV